MDAGCCTQGKGTSEQSPWAARAEQACVILGGITLILGAVLENRGASMAAWVSFGISYASGGYFGLISAWQSLRARTIDIDLLMLLAAIGAASVGAPFEGALLLFLFALSNVLQTYALGRNQRAIEALATLRPQVAHVLRGNEVVDVPLDAVAVGDRFILRPGDQVPLDAQVVEGESSVDQSSVTGESIPAGKGPGSALFAGTLNLNGSLTAEATRVAEDSTLARMIKLVAEAQSRKARSQRFLEEAEQRYAVGVILFTILLGLGLPTIFGLSWSDGLYRAITVMVVASPCALVISTPATILAAIANGARHGILFKGGAQLEKASRIRAVAFDKTGTLTRGRPEVVGIHLADTVDLDEDAVLQWAGSIEARSEHPLADAVVRYARSRGIELLDVHGFHSKTGFGVTAKVADQQVSVGKLPWITNPDTLPTRLNKAVGTWREAGHTLIGVSAITSENNQGYLLAVLAIADPVRPEASDVIAQLRNHGIRSIAMLTGDSLPVAHSIAASVGVDAIHADLLPEDKVHKIHQMAADTEIAMVGDGTNDAPALASASLGIAMGAAGSDIAMESADVVLMANDLHKLVHVLALSRAAHRVVIQNLVFAGSIIVLMVLATLFLPLTGIEVPLPVGVLAHEGGTVLVCLNGLRLLGFKPSTPVSAASGE